MGRKFDARLPNMTDEELAGVDEQALNETSLQKLAVERRKRETKSAQALREEGRFWNRTNASIALGGIIVGAAVALFMC